MRIRGLFWTMFLASVLALITLTDMFSLYAVEADADVNSKFQQTGMGREHRIPLVRIRCMTNRRWKEVRKVWRGLGGKPPRRQVR